MSNKVNLGGSRIRSGAEMEVELPHYERSNHNLTSVWKSSMAPGTITPIMGILCQNEDTMDIEFDVDIQTNPTLGALYGSFKFQIDTFLTPFSLYCPLLLINETDFDAKKVFIPQVTIFAKNLKTYGQDDNAHINPSSIFKYQGISGCGYDPTQGDNGVVKRTFPMVKWLIYWDVVKNYYANKQETMAHVIHNDTKINTNILAINLEYRGTTTVIDQQPVITPVGLPRFGQIIASWTAVSGNGQDWALVFILDDGREIPLIEMYQVVRPVSGVNYTIQYDFLKPEYYGVTVNSWRFVNPEEVLITAPKLVEFPLKNIDEVRRSILRSLDDTQAFVMDASNAAEPYKFALEGDATFGYSATRTQEGLAVKTYQSDKFNNYLKTEFITGAGGVNELSRIDVSSGYLEIEALNLGKKVYKMLNAVAAADKTWSGYQKAIWGNDGEIKVTSPVFVGGLSKEIVFQEVVSTGAGTYGEGQEPLGTIVGRGRLGEKHNGGRVSVKVNTISYLTAYASITPYISYSQGNEWDMNLKTLDDIHKPALDQIGFQDRDTDEMAWWDTEVDAMGTLTIKSAGKQPAWIDYMTSYDQVYGNFAIENAEQYMVLTRRYHRENKQIGDLSTYIDPSNFNHIFAQTSLDAMNFKVMIRKRITARRKISAKIMPNV